MQPQSEIVRGEVWNKFLRIASFHRYLLRMEGRYSRFRTAFRCVSYAVSVATFSTFIASMDSTISVGLSLLLAVTVALDQVLSPGDKAATLHHARMGVAEIERKFRALWVDVQWEGGKITPDAALDRANELIQDAAQYYTLVDRMNEKVHVRCTEEAEKAESERYA